MRDVVMDGGDDFDLGLASFAVDFHFRHLRDEGCVGTSERPLPACPKPDTGSPDLSAMRSIGTDSPVRVLVSAPAPNSTMSSSQPLNSAASRLSLPRTSSAAMKADSVMMKLPRLPPTPVSKSA